VLLFFAFEKISHKIILVVVDEAKQKKSHHLHTKKTLEAYSKYHLPHSTALLPIIIATNETSIHPIAFTI
jgi:hypothetical protein